MRVSFRALYILLLVPGMITAQNDKQYWNWYFGNLSAIQFTSTSLPPLPVTTSVMSANEGASTVSDTNGNLLYYSNGQTVWDRLNQVLPNGTNLKGHFYSAQSALIVRMPGSDSLYYIFTVNNWTDAFLELNYSIIDKSMNGGYGAVTAQKNILVNDHCAEHLTAAYHENGTDIWILSHEVGNNHFVAYLLTSMGLNTVPVVSATGAIYGGANRFGYMRVSPYCNRIATALGKQFEVTIPDTTAQVFDFDNSTGIVSNAVFIADLTNMDAAYCCEFSPDNSKLYFTEFNKSGIYQVDLNAPNPAATITNISSLAFGVNASLTLGPDNKIYVTKSGASYIGAINSPNLVGALCNHVDNALTISGTNSISTCNILKQCSCVQNLSLGNDTTICEGHTVTLSGGSATSYLWSTGSTTPSINISTSGTYWLEATKGQCVRRDSLSIFTDSCEFEIEFPNVFTPNNDGLNDNFMAIKYKGMLSGTLQIFNRWGEELFYTNNILQGWNGYYKGNICSDGIYIWLVQYTTIQHESKKMSGFLSLLK